MCIRDSARLPAKVTDRLLAGSYATPEEVQAAIDLAREEIAEVASAQAVINTPNPAATVVSDEFSRAEEALRYIFGSREAKTPPPNMRSLRQLWVNWTGDSHIPVSYTHLDVYKRQVLFCTTSLGICHRSSLL